MVFATEFFVWRIPYENDRSGTRKTASPITSVIVHITLVRESKSCACVSSTRKDQLSRNESPDVLWTDRHVARRVFLTGATSGSVELSLRIPWRSKGTQKANYGHDFNTANEASGLGAGVFFPVHIGSEASFSARDVKKNCWGILYS